MALGTATELKQVFADRPILEVQASRPVDAMATLDGCRRVEKTSLFGTTVHAVLQAGDRSGAADLSAAPAAASTSRQSAP